MSELNRLLATAALLASVSACGGVVETRVGAGAGGTAPGVMTEPASGGASGGVSLPSASGNGGATDTTQLPGTPPGEVIVTLSTAAKDPSALVVDASFVYFTDFGENSSGGLYKTPIGGGATQPLASLTMPAGLALSGDSLYVSAGSALQRMDRDGKNADTLAMSFSNDPIALGPGGVYGTGNSGVDTNVAIVNVALTGGKVTALTSDGALSNSSFESYGLAVDENSVYFTTFSAPMSIMKVSLQGGAVETLAQSAGPGGGIAIDATSVYWADGSGLLKVSKLGGAVQTLSSVPAGFVGGIALDASNVYWTSASTVQRVALQGGPTFTIADNQNGPSVITVDDSSVYWANGAPSGAGAIMRATPK